MAPPSEINDKQDGHPRLKRVLMITALLLCVISLALTAAYFLPWKRGGISGWGGEDFDDDDVEDEEPEDLSCDQLTRTRSQDQYYACLVYGPTKFLVPEERAKIDAKIFSPGKEAFRILEKDKTMKKKNKRVKRQTLHGPYQNLNKDNYSIKHQPSDAKSAFKNVRNLANDPFYFDPGNMFKTTHETWQAQPPWSYTGDFGVKDWHHLDLEKFLVPISKKLDLNKHDRLLRAVFTDLWDEYKFIHPDEKKFQDAFFYNRTPPERKLIYKLIYAVPYADKRVKGYDYIPPKIFVFDPKDKNLPAKHKIESKVRALTNFIKPRLYLGKKDILGVDKEFTGYYSFMRFYIEHRPSVEEVESHPEVFSASFKRNPPPEGADFGKIIKILTKQDKDEIHKLTEEELKFVDLIQKIAVSLGYRFDSKKKEFGKFQTYNEQLIEWIQNQWVENQLDQEESQSKYSINVFPKRMPICSDKEPSPLNIIKNNTQDSSLPPYKLNRNGERYNRYYMYIPGDGTSNLFVSFEGVSIEYERAIELSGGPTRSFQKMYFETMMIKFGVAGSGRGSEHRVDGQSFDMELQIMFTYNGPSGEQPFWFTLSRQMNDLFPFRGKLVHIISVFVKVDPDLDREGPDALIFESFAQSAYELRKQIEEKPTGDHARITRNKDFTTRLMDFLPKNSSYYHYRGGLTMPPCFGYVTWSVYDKPLRILPEQYTEFQFVRAPAEISGFMAGNIRTTDDIWTAYENEPGILHSERERRKEERVNRAVLRSLTSDTTQDQTYDYYLDYDGGTLTKPSGILICILILLITFVFLVFQR